MQARQGALKLAGSGGCTSIASRRSPKFKILSPCRVNTAARNRRASFVVNSSYLNPNANDYSMLDDEAEDPERVKEKFKEMLLRPIEPEKWYMELDRLLTRDSFIIMLLLVMLGCLISNTWQGAVSYFWIVGLLCIGIKAFCTASREHSVMLQRLVEATKELARRMAKDRQESAKQMAKLSEKLDNLSEQMAQQSSDRAGMGKRLMDAISLKP